MEMGVHSVIFPDEYVFENLKTVFIRRYISYIERYGMKSVSQFATPIPENQLPIHKMVIKEEESFSPPRYTSEGSFSQHNRLENIVGSLVTTNVNNLNYLTTSTNVTLYIYDLKSKNFQLKYTLPNSFSKHFPKFEKWRGYESLQLIDKYAIITLATFNLNDDGEIEKLNMFYSNPKNVKIILELNSSFSEVLRFKSFDNMICLCSFIFSSYHQKAIFARKNLKEGVKTTRNINKVVESYSFFEFDMKNKESNDEKKIFTIKRLEDRFSSGFVDEPVLCVEDNLLSAYFNGIIYFFDIRSLQLKSVLNYVENKIYNLEVKTVEKYASTDIGRLIIKSFLQGNGLTKEQLSIRINCWRYFGCINGKIYFKIGSTLNGFYPFSSSYHFMYLGEITSPEHIKYSLENITINGKSVNDDINKVIPLIPTKGNNFLKVNFFRHSQQLFVPCEDLIIVDQNHSVQYGATSDYNLTCMKIKERLGMQDHENFGDKNPEPKLTSELSEEEKKTRSMYNHRWDLMSKIDMDVGKVKKGKMFSLGDTLKNCVLYPCDRFNMIRIAPFVGSESGNHRYREMHWIDLKNGKKIKTRNFRVKKETLDVVLIDKIILVKLEK